ncbi:hypothetical protein N6H18_02760 [Reichenbachiella agarivorans]|uniref:Uncharacterized protein n=1 Tax=Reichenbachiella agarivorans TaxID=2979464 RepID=A0ABY6CQU9_9BACT|nr:hypothetical protein [Reichenbachiella agarivorans]UXP32877.1 hypothetical protein N6H18_02760 [Reichenbachiella agarivorans]
MKLFKSIALALLLFLPAGVYLFLQGFGENKFEIPVYYQTGLDTLTTCGRIMVPQQYYVEPNVAIDSLIKRKTTLYDFGLLSDARFRSERNNLMSFLMKYMGEDRIQLVSLYAQDSIQRIEGYPMIQYIRAEASVITAFSSCQLISHITLSTEGILQQIPQLVLVDEQDRIRGYFNPSDLEDIDRLNTEVYILLNE